MDTQEGTETKKKRTTIADLKKDLQEVEQIIDENILDELAAHDARIEKIETGMTILQGNQSTLTNQYIEQQKRLDEEKPDGAVTNVTDRLTALETGFLADSPAVWNEIDRRLTALENATGALADAMRVFGESTVNWGTQMEAAEVSIRYLEGVISDMQESATHTEPVPLPRPIPEAAGRIDPDALKAVAQSSQTMNDVLHMTRFLKVASDITDQERREIMAIACQAAGVPYADNLLARAGVRSFEA